MALKTTMRRKMMDLRTTQIDIKKEITKTNICIFMTKRLKTKGKKEKPLVLDRDDSIDTSYIISITRKKKDYNIYKIEKFSRCKLSDIA